MGQRIATTFKVVGVEGNIYIFFKLNTTVHINIIKRIVIIQSIYQDMDK